jgi:type IV pilus assembly protein PilN
MIRINLLEETRAARKGAAGPAVAMPGVPGAPQAALMYALQALIPVLAVLVVAVLWVLWGTEIRGLNQDIEEARAEVKRLEGVIKLNDELQKKRALLQRKIEVIEDLKKNQTLPVIMMDQLSQNLVDLVWLDSLRVTGKRIALQGKAQTSYAFAAFLRNLERSDYFAAIVPESIVDQGGLQVWSMSFDFDVPQKKTEPAAQVSELR